MISPNNQSSLQNGNQMGRLSNAFFIHGGRNTAMEYPVAAGYDAFLVDEENKMFFIKSNDMTGRTINLREFKYSEVTPKQENQSSFDTSNFATKDDLNLVLEEIRKLQKGRDREHHYNRNNRRNRNGKPYNNEQSSYAV